ncbi:alanine racemase [Kiloniella laminariae]|uniref:Alanine racemase n=1 Tax=Kiloniella laminariae TaxID=454162 RepID=A0ABT4LEM4_9PROT|nr:alanine racemase [Kiloniella laminariae]MCZ4279543.1 alanine racemase [Kiloniella laminariae]
MVAAKKLTALPDWAGSVAQPTPPLSKAVQQDNTLATKRQVTNLPPTVDPRVEYFLGQTPLLQSLKSGFGGPVHLLFPRIFRETAQDYINLLESFSLKHQIFFAKKANKAACFVQECARLGIGIDTASIEELVAALKGGVSPHLIGITGPAKNDRLLILALQQGCLLAIDALDELQRAASFARQLARPLRCLIRLRPDDQKKSRFGFSTDELPELWHQIDQLNQPQETIRMEGLSFHLSGYNTAERAAMAFTAISLLSELSPRFPYSRRINIGGGLPLSYASASAWQDFQASQSPDDFHGGKQFGGGFYPYHCETPGLDALRNILQTPNPAGKGDLASLLRAQDMELMLEPGRALLDQSGVTLFSVQGVKERKPEASKDGYSIITVDGTSFSLSEQWFDSEFLPDPRLLSSRKADCASTLPAPLFRAAIGGVSCLDSDMLSWRKIVFPRRPEVGDLLCYLNTAGYQMDSNESEFHGLPLPQKICLFLRNGVPAWCRDTDYCAVLAEDHSSWN